MDKISVIIPCFNSATTLKRSLDSVFCQTYPNIEVIAIDDGSTDDTVRILNEYKHKNNNFTYISKPNAGVSMARNDGLKLASGNLIQFLDSDDNFLYDNVLERLVNTMHFYNTDIVSFNFTHPCFHQHLAEGLYDLTNEDHFMDYYQDFFVSMLPWNKLFKREILTNKYNPDLSFAEDEIFNLENLKNVKSVYVISDILHNYYCQDTAAEKTSALNKTLAEEKFWETNTTIWYKGNNNVPYRKEIILKDYSGLYDKMIYVRSFDFLFWDLMFMCNSKVPPQHMLLELKRIFKEDNFINSLKAKEVYGIKVKSFDDEKLDNMLLNFIERSINVFGILKDNNLNGKVYFAMLKIFGEIFCEFDNIALQAPDVLAKAYFNDLQVEININISHLLEAKNDK